MKKWLCLVAFCSAVQVRATPLVVMIDPGHGGRDHGTVKDGINEADITLTVALRLKDLLLKDRRFQPLLTREQDSSISLYRRAKMSKDKKADVFVSIHVNSSPDVRARGAEFYFQNQLPPDQESMFLAHKENVADAGEEVEPITYDFLDHTNYSAEVSAILNDLMDGQRVLRSSQLSTTVRESWRGTRKLKSSNSVRQAPFYVLNQMRSPSILVELGFLTNHDDYRELTNSQAQAKMAEDLYHGLVSYKDSMDKITQSP